MSTEIVLFMSFMTLVGDMRNGFSPPSSNGN
jgi:hypothetical protein